MSEARLHVAPDSAPRDAVVTELKILLSQLFGISPAEIAHDVSLVELGADSLFLLQASQAIRDKFGVKLPFRMMLEEYSTVAALAGYIGQNLSPSDDGGEADGEAARTPAQDASGEGRESLPETPTPAVTHGSPRAAVEPRPELPAAPTPTPVPTLTSSTAPAYDSDAGGRPAAASNMERLFAQQLQIMAQQLEVLGRRQAPGAGVAARSTAQPAAPARAPSAPQTTLQTSQPAPPAAAPPEEPTKPYVAYVPIRDGLGGGMTPQQRQHLEELTERLTRRTRGSKQLAQTYRPVHADNRTTAGFRLLWKEMQYPLFVERGAGSRLWDVDGNEYLDVTMGFGALLFGHSPDFVVRALEAQVGRGIQLGGASPLAARSAELVSELTGAERVGFCNSGTEAVMSALRLARTVTGRSKIALFEGGYHGTFDGVMVRGERVEGGRLRAIPLAPGVPQHMIDNVILLSPDDPDCGDLLREHGRDVAAVLLEPLQNRRPDMQPGPFLKEMRRAADDVGAALIFDEVVSGFRFHPGGAQAVFGVKADLVAYGKAVGAGLPVGVVAGKAKYMDAIDGGMWNYGDDSYPRAETTFVAGTYFKHPLVMAAVHATLKHLKESGPALQERLNERTARLVRALGDYFKAEGVPMRMASFASLFRFMFPRDLNFTEIFYYYMLEQGIYICETRNCLYSTAHTDEDDELILEAVRRSVAQMREGGFLPAPARPPGGGKATSRETAAAALAAEAPSAAPAGNGGARAEALRTLPLTEGQKGIWSTVQFGGEAASCAYNQSFAMRLRGRFDPEAMRRAINDLLARHEALRITVSPGGEHQLVHSSMTIEVPLIDLSSLGEPEREARARELQSGEGRAPFDLVTGPLVRARILRMGERLYVLLLSLHHLVTDGWSNGTLFRELSLLYEGRCRGVAPGLPPPVPYSEYVARESERAPDEGEAEDEAYWLARFSDSVPPLELPTDRPRPPVKTYPAVRERLPLARSLYDGLKGLGARHGCTLFMTGLAGFNLLLHRLTNQHDLVVGITAAGQLAAGGQDVVGYCINLLPIRSRLEGDPAFADYLAGVKQTVLEAYRHQRYPLRRLLQKLNPPRDPSRLTLISATFNLDRGGSPPADSRAASAGVGDSGALEVEFLSFARGFMQWELYFNLVEADGGLVLESDCNTDLFNVETLHHWMEAYVALLEIVVARPRATFGELDAALDEFDSRRQAQKVRTLEEARLKKFDRLKRRAV
ncbi:MAG: aminotransferase class III-fold pyridoxal phosphate-dependent enzyme [Pyrinomonadaceae bacterium]